MKKYFKIISLSIFILIFSLFQVKQTMAMDKIFSEGQNFIQAGSSLEDGDYVNEESLKSSSDNIYNTFLIVGIILMAVIGMILGIKFVTSGVEEKAQVKETLIPYVIGCVVILGAFGIWKLSISIFSGLDKINEESIYQKSQEGYCTCGEPLFSPPNSKYLFSPIAEKDNNGKTIDGVKHEW